jgi:hypothetical protein
MKIRIENLEKRAASVTVPTAVEHTSDTLTFVNTITSGALPTAHLHLVADDVIQSYQQKTCLNTSPILNNGVATTCVGRPTRVSTHSETVIDVTEETTLEPPRSLEISSKPLNLREDIESIPTCSVNGFSEENDILKGDTIQSHYLLS